MVIGGGNGTGDANVRVLRFDGTDLHDTGAVYDSAVTINSVSWSPNGEYLVVGTDDTGDTAGEALVFSFDGYVFTPELLYDHGGIIHSVDWSQNGKYIALGGAGVYSNITTTTTAVRVLFGVMEYPSKCLIDSDKACNSTGVNAGIGIAGSGGTNPIVRNIACENDTNLGTGIFNFSQGLGGAFNSLDNFSVPPYGN